MKLPLIYSLSKNWLPEHRLTRYGRLAKGGYLVILKRFGEDGGLELTFGGGFSPLECFMEIEKVLARDSGKEETPWEPKKK